MNEMQKFRAEAERRNLCDVYSKRWDNCRSNKQLVDLALDSNGLPYLCESYVKRWGLSDEYILRRFSAYINGRYTAQLRGYTSRLYVCHYDNVIISSTNTVFLNCRLSIIVPANTVCIIYLANSQVDIIGSGECYIRKYGRSAIRTSKSIKIIQDAI